MPKPVQDLPPDASRTRRRDWQGDRRPVMVRLPASVAHQLEMAAQAERRSVSETAAELIEAGLSSGGRP